MKKRWGGGIKMNKPRTVLALAKQTELTEVFRPVKAGLGVCCVSDPILTSFISVEVNVPLKDM